MSQTATTKSGPSMSITVDRSHLLAELAAVQGVVDQKSAVPILTSVLLEARDNQTLHIAGTDLAVSLRTFCPAAVRFPGSCAVPARKLYDYVRLLPEGEINIKLLENHWVRLQSGRSNTKMVGLGRENFPTLALFPGDIATRLSVRLLQTLIHKTAFAISQEESRYVLNGALLLIKPGSLTMVATDGHRLACMETRDTAVSVKEEVRVLIPRKALTLMSSLLNAGETEFVNFARDASSLFFVIGKRLFTCRLLNGQFPNYEAILPQDLTKSVEMPADELLRALQRVSQFTDERSGSVRLGIEADVLRISSMNESSGESEDTIGVTYAGDPSTIRFNAGYLLDFAKVAGTGRVKFHFKGTDVAGDFRLVEPEPTNTYRYIVMPMRA